MCARSPWHCHAVAQFYFIAHTCTYMCSMLLECSNMYVHVYHTCTPVDVYILQNMPYRLESFHPSDSVISFLISRVCWRRRTVTMHAAMPWQSMLPTRVGTILIYIFDISWHGLRVPAFGIGTGTQHCHGLRMVVWYWDRH